MDEERKYWVAFSACPDIGPVRFRILLDRYKTAKDAWTSLKKNFPIDDYVKKVEQAHVAVLTLSDVKYPALLKQIPDAPFLLYIKGHHSREPMNLSRTIGVVGTRHVTPYGEEVTRKLVRELVSRGFTIVSGLANGVDTIAHQTAIDMGGKTIAVLGCGIDIIAPPGNARLYAAIAEGGYGAIVSEMPLGFRPDKKLFTARNRIISGLSLGVVVTEGAEYSGALITARYAAEQGREVFAVPGPITSRYSRAPAKLLKNGAKLVESADDILEELNICI